MKYYAKMNKYGSSTSVGFGNTWRVLVFTTKKARDGFVDTASDDNVSVSSIKKSDITSFLYVTPRPFTGEAYYITDYGDFDCSGYIGDVEVAHTWRDDYKIVDRLF